MLKLCGETEDKLAQELIHFELQVERDVIEPLFLLAEVRSGMRPKWAGKGRTEQWPLVILLQPYNWFYPLLYSVTLLFVGGYDYTPTWSGLSNMEALSAVHCPVLPPTLLSVGIPVEKGAKLAASPPYPAGSPLPHQPSPHPSEVFSEITSSPSSQGTGAPHPTDSVRPFKSSCLYRTLLLDVKGH